MDQFEILKASFDGYVIAANNSVLSQYGTSTASIEENIKSLFPEDFDKSKNVDLLPVVFNLAVVNQFNRNGDGMNAETAAAAVKYFTNKPINVEHKKDQIVGHILNASFSYKEGEFNDNDPDSFKDETKPFYITAAGVIYRHIFPKLAGAIVNASNEESDDYKSISTSWEIGFKKFKMVHQPKALSLVSEASDITDEKIAIDAKKSLIAYKGKGIDKNGKFVGRIIMGEVLPLGAGLTYSPAANVEGVFVVADKEKDEEIEEIDSSEQKKQKVLKNNSLIAKNIVRIEKFKEILSMDEKQFNTFISKLEQSVASFTTEESQAKSIGLVMKDALSEYSKSWEEKINQEKQEAQASKDNLKTLQSSFDTIKSELDALKQESEIQAAASLFNARMNFIESEYDFAEAELSLVVNDLKTIEASDTAFEAFKSKLSVLFSHKLKTAIASQEEAVKLKIEEEVAKRLQSNASSQEEEKGEQELELESEAELIPNGSEDASKKESLVEKLRKTFSVEVKM